MQLITSFVIVATALVVSVSADTHRSAVCSGDKLITNCGGTPFSPCMSGFSKKYDVDGPATDCACKLYKNRNQGSEWWNTCKDCDYDGLQCNSPEGHIGGDEMNYYCTKKCGAKGSEAD